MHKMIDFSSRSPEQTGPLMLDTVEYLQPGIAHFPLLADKPVAHGFTWGPNTPNMSFKYHEGDREVMTQRNEEFLRTLGMAPLRHVVGVPAGDGIFQDVNADYLASTTPEDIGYYPPVHTAFTKLPDVPLVNKPGDCLASLVYGTTVRDEPFIGLIHTGRKELETNVAGLALQEVVRAYDSDPAALIVAISPGLAQRNHKLWGDYIADLDVEAWKNHVSFDEDGSAYLDDTDLLIKQYLQAGVPVAHVTAYNVDTYEAAARGEGYSHRYSQITGDARSIGRGMIAIQLASV